MSPLSSEALLARASHRQQWSLPARRWFMAQSWHHLLFAHWPLPPAVLRPLIPADLDLDTFDGQAWLTIVPFEMCHVHWRGVPEVPFFSTFPELNVRTYVDDDGKPGVWFFSLDADHIPAVLAARTFFHLPYFKARMSVLLRDDTVLYRSFRQYAMRGVFRGAYRPTSPVFHAQPGTLEYWLTERYYLYAADKHQRLYRAAVHHVPWPLQTAAADIVVNSVAHDIPLPDTEPLLHYADKLDVLTWPLEPI